jgi:hypothetical protein
MNKLEQLAALSNLAELTEQQLLELRSEQDYHSCFINTRADNFTKRFMSEMVNLDNPEDLEDSKFPELSKMLQANKEKLDDFEYFLNHTYIMCRCYDGKIGVIFERSEATSEHHKLTLSVTYQQPYEDWDFTDDVTLTVSNTGYPFQLELQVLLDVLAKDYNYLVNAS